MEHGENCGCPENPLESKGNIYQHPRKSQEGNPDGLLAKFSTNFGSDDFGIANRKRTNHKVVFHGGNNRRRRAVHPGKIQKFFCKLRVLVAGGSSEVQRISLVERVGESIERNEIEIRFGGIGDAVGGIQGRDDASLAGIHGLVFGALLFDEDQNFVGALTGQSALAHGLDLCAAKTLGRKALAQVVDVRSLGEANVHVRATFEVDAVIEPALLPNGDPTSEKKNGAEGIEILGFAHPINVGLFEELDHSAFTSLP